MSGLHLSRLALSHFRSHHRTEISVDARPVAIYGPNGAGKTNLLEAVSLFSPGRGMRQAAAQDMVRRPEALGWKVSGILHSDGRAHEVAHKSENGNPRQVSIDGKTAAQTALGRLSRVLWLVPSMDRLWIESAEGRRRFLDRMTLSFEPAHADLSLDYAKAMRERNRLLKDQVRDARWYAALEAQLARTGAQIHQNRLTALEALRQAQDGAETSFPTADLELTHNDSELPDTENALREALAASRSRDMIAGRTLIGPHRADLVGTYSAKGVPARDCSTGEQKALLISLILANARALAADLGTPPIVLLDEVAAHLDETRRAALYDEICALGAQAWMTGTESGLFEALGDRAQRLMVSDSAGTSKVVTVGLLA
ncbi:DNA replication/repair protein RecF [Pseudoprimorskyibacter insulae]|uniref:DNA replication and repair protein RecF n=1 Tax=Pseudoprimorskyibacter insulae TaxID=1695997 RepID=A0A2R8AYS8_9RHOB|nr:DNA replication/repair protein RecF [Pseudoprimorskyibacter insulae]SPF81193.1 DNA replication and repair protein RecF [Pseudoprimorskyibacter insulae]